MTFDIMGTVKNEKKYFFDNGDIPFPELSLIYMKEVRHEGFSHSEG